MKFAIGTPVPVKASPATFEVVIEVMFGDADGDKKFKVGPFLKGKDEPALESLLETLQRMKERFPNGRGGSREYNYTNVEGFEAWFGTSVADNEQEYLQNYRSTVPYEDFKKHHDLAEPIFERGGYPDWPMEPYGDGLDATFDSVKIFFYDENLRKHNVNIL